MTRNAFVAWVLTHVFARPGASADRQQDDRQQDDRQQDDRQQEMGQDPRHAPRLFIGLGIPFVAVVPTVPLLSRLDWLVFGVPAEVAWLFCCIPLTSACLAVCWFAYDRHEDGG